MNTNIENDFINDTMKNDRVLLSIGQKSSGKTHFLINYIKFALYKNIYTEYHLCLPSYQYEQNQSYDFLKQSKNNIYIYMINIMK